MMKTDSLIFWLIFLILCTFVFKNRNLMRNGHFLKIRDARRIYGNLNEITNCYEGWLISYLRKINPYVFEELILYAFKKHGYKIYRNRRYSNDGGIDGKVKKDGKKYLIQAKRYSAAINPCHVRNFIDVCRKMKMKGYFVHTGRTGDMSKELQKNNPEIKFISGSELGVLFLKSESDCRNIFFDE